jgi:uncharacterized protein involved in exopolysaccharide biosynthesis
VELRFLIELLWRKKITFIVLFLATFLSVVFLSWRITPTYDATAKIQMRKSPAISAFMKAIGIQESASSSTTYSDSELADYKEVVLSEPLVDELISRLQLKRERRWSQLTKMVPFGEIVMGIAGLDELKTMKPVVQEELTSPGLLNMLFPGPSLRVKMHADSNIISLTAESCQYAEAIDIANTLAEMFLANEIKRTKEDFNVVRQFANNKLQASFIAYENAMAQVKKIRERNATLSLSDDMDALTDEINRLRQVKNSTLVNIETTRATLEKNKERLAKTPVYQKASEQFKENSILTSLRQNIIETEIELARVRTLYTSEHPEYIELLGKLKQAEEKLKSETLKVFSSETLSIDPLVTGLIQGVAESEATLEGQKAQVSNCDIQIRNLQSQVGDFIQKQNELNTLVAREKTSANMYTIMLEFVTQVEAAESMALANMKIIEPATRSEKVGKHKHPSILINSILGFILACIFAFSGVMLLEYMDPRVFNLKDIPEGDFVAFKVVVPDFSRSRSRIFPRIPERISFRMLARAFSSELEKASAKIVGMLPLKTDVGCTTVTARLASELAATDKNVLVLTSDEAAATWRTIENDQISFDQLLQGAGEQPKSKLTTVELSGAANNKIKDVLSRARERFDVVLFDLPAFFEEDEAFDYLEMCDASVLVIKAGQTPPGAISRIHQIIPSNVQKIGMILNRHRPGLWSVFSREVSV